ncbi:MAG: sulfotransferase [Flavobacteriaceae bacterium]|nr:sulfotransferase [Flavobacteriaceae bacterium]
MEKNQLHNWKAPEGVVLPNFIIGGAMKSGTSTMHAILDQHPKIFIPHEEIGFFDIDNVIEHYDFNFYDRKSQQWTVQEMGENPQQLWDWYSSKFKEGEGMLRGEDSTSYLTSKFAAQRISIQEKEIKLIFMLRQPSKRAYSNYHHLVRAGIVAHSFEDVLQYHPNSVLRRSLYLDQLEAYYKFIPKKNIKVVIFEDLIENSKSVMKEVCEFLEIDMDEFDSSVFETHSNAGKFPLFSKPQLLKNLLFRRYGNSFNLKSLPIEAPNSVVKRVLFPKIINRLHGLVNPLKVRKKTVMKPATKQFLDAYFKKELTGLDELVGRDILDKWFP